jgi:hypothetical protein
VAAALAEGGLVDVDITEDGARARTREGEIQLLMPITRIETQTLARS